MLLGYELRLADMDAQLVDNFFFSFQDRAVHSRAMKTRAYLQYLHQAHGPAK